jgi:hypothetical protein
MTGDSVDIGNTPQASGVTVNNFTNPVTYDVVAEDGSINKYTVTVTNASASDKDITAYSLSGISMSISGTTITGTAPNGTDLKALVASFTTTGKTVKVGDTIQVSGTTANDFSDSKTVTYVVTAEDASTKSYTVTVTAASAAAGQIIADHTVVDKYNLIPQYYINEVKKMWINIPGESHSAAYRTGMTLLMNVDSKFAANVTERGTPGGATDQYVRVSRAVASAATAPVSWGYGTGEAVWYTWYAWPSGSQPAVKDRIKNHIQYCKNNNMNLAAIGFGWCWDTTWHNSPGGTSDSIFNVRWAGASEGGPDGDRIWGLDSDDYSLTQNRVSMDTYLNATEEYRLFAESIGALTKVIFTTGAIDGYTGESGYQRHLKYERIRNFAKADSDRILFDYADILCYSDAGVLNTATWNSHTYPIIHATNLGDGSVGHIGNAGALRLAKAQWWMLARIAGWDGVSQ